MRKQRRQEMQATTCQKVAQFLYGDARGGEGFWYAHPLQEVEGLTEEQLFWVPNPKSLCMLWHVGHIAHRERTHIGRFLEGLDGEIIPAPFEIFGTEWCSVEELRQSIDSVDHVFEWVDEVRKASKAFIASLDEEGFYKVLPSSDFGEGFSVAHWLFITVSHGAVHIGRIQMMRAMLEGKYDRTC
jgi:hypothetical protein